MVLKEVTLDNKSDLEFVEKLYIESFPRNERRPILEMLRLMKDESRFCVLLLEVENNTRVGFVTYWKFETFVFVEHLAVVSNKRSAGYGDEAVQVFIKQTPLPLVGEIELPSASESAARRVKFYEKQGFQLWDFSYLQPPYEEGFEPVPMLITLHGDLGFPSGFEAVRDTIYTQIYKINTNDR